MSLLDCVSSVQTELLLAAAWNDSLSDPREREVDDVISARQVELDIQVETTPAERITVRLKARPSLTGKARQPVASSVLAGVVNATAGGQQGYQFAENQLLKNEARKVGLYN